MPWVFLAAWAFPSCDNRGLLFVAVHRFLTAVAFHVEHGLQAFRLPWSQLAGSVVVARGLERVDSVVVAHGLNCCLACGIFPDQGLNPCPLHW